MKTKKEEGFISSNSYGTWKGCFIWGLVCIGIFTVIVLLIPNEPDVQYAHSVIREEMLEFVYKRKGNLEKFSTVLIDCGCHTDLFISRDWVQKIPGMIIYCDGERNDTFQHKRELFDLYQECFNKNPYGENGPEIHCKQSIVIYDWNFGMNYCNIYPILYYTKLDTLTLKSRYPELPFYSKESQPSDSECTFIWQIDDNWYMISD